VLDLRGSRGRRTARALLRTWISTLQERLNRCMLPGGDRRLEGARALSLDDGLLLVRVNLDAGQ
jgi:hypothetical protein